MEARHTRIASRIAGDHELLLAAPSGFCRAVARYNLGLRVGEDEIAETAQAGLMPCMKGGLQTALKAISRQVLRKEGIDWKRVLADAWRGIEAKLDIRRAFRKLWALVKQKGWKLGTVALLLDIFQNIVLPVFAMAIGRPEMIPTLRGIRLEPIVMPIAACALKGD